jgi:hypothetical protein
MNELFSVVPALKDRGVVALLCSLLFILSFLDFRAFAADVLDPAALKN